MLVIQKQALDTTQNLASAMNALKNDQVVDVTDGTLFFVGELILIDSERMRIVDITGNNLTVVRAYDGSRSEEHTSELQSLMRISYAVFCLKKKKKIQHTLDHTNHKITNPADNYTPLLQ